MSTEHQRERLHNFLETADPQKVAAMYAIMEKELAPEGVIYDEGLQKKLEQRRKEFENGSVVPVNDVQSKTRIAAILNSRLK